VITGVEFDHPDFFNTPNQLVESFSHFVGQLPDDGLLICCSDDITAQIFARNRQIVHMPNHLKLVVKQIQELDCCVKT
jgi:UDP-N-acetylmuramate-alanine ligase